MSAKNKNLQDKKNKVLGRQKKPNFLLMGFIGVIAIIIVAVFVYSGNSNKPNNVGGQVQNVGSQDYASQNIPMKDIKAEFAAGKLSINLDDVKQNKIIRFEDPNANLTLKSGEVVPLPLVAFANAKGDIKVAIADCEPCSSTRFHIEGNELVCNACGTRWTLDNLAGVSGGCTAYPPDQKAYTVLGNKIVIDESTINNWKPRA